MEAGALDVQVADDDGFGGGLILLGGIFGWFFVIVVGIESGKEVGEIGGGQALFVGDFDAVNPDVLDFDGLGEQGGKLDFDVHLGEVEEAVGFVAFGVADVKVFEKEGVFFEEGEVEGFDGGLLDAEEGGDGEAEGGADQGVDGKFGGENEHEEGDEDADGDSEGTGEFGTGFFHGTLLFRDRGENSTAGVKCNQAERAKRLGLSR